MRITINRTTYQALKHWAAWEIDETLVTQDGAMFSLEISDEAAEKLLTISPDIEQALQILLKVEQKT